MCGSTAVVVNPCTILLYCDLLGLHSDRHCTDVCMCGSMAVVFNPCAILLYCDLLGLHSDRHWTDVWHTAVHMAVFLNEYSLIYK